MNLIRQLWVLPVDVRLAAHANKLRFRPRSYSHVGSVPMLDVLDKPIRDWGFRCQAYLRYLLQHRGYLRGCSGRFSSAQRLP